MIIYHSCIQGYKYSDLWIYAHSGDSFSKIYALYSWKDYVDGMFGLTKEVRDKEKL